jgi:hypothetical protein
VSIRGQKQGPFMSNQACSRQPLRELGFIPQSLASFMQGLLWGWLPPGCCWAAAAAGCWLLLLAGAESVTAGSGICM